MDFQFSEEQGLLADSVKRLVAEYYDFESRKQIIAQKGMSDTVWSQMAEMGLLGLPISEANGGFQSGAMGMLATMEAIGEGLLLEPYLQTVGICARIIDRHGSASQKAMLEKVIAGECKMALAQTEAGGRYDLAHVASGAKAEGNDFVLNGAKTVVVHAPFADYLIVSARTSGSGAELSGISLFLVAAKSAGLSLKTERTVDNQRSADLVLSNVRVGKDALLGTLGQGHDILDEAIDFANVLLCAEAVGAMKFADATTLEYLKTRKQFGVTIGSFQALQHRMVDMTVSTKQAESITLLAATAVDQAAEGKQSAKERRRTVAAARIKIADACRHVGQEAIQLHGGMGMTQEMKVSHTFKRLTMIGHSFGDADHFLQRFAEND